jgi:hypothetical protein
VVVKEAKVAGKFEGNTDEKLAEYLYQLSLDGYGEELGDVQDFGWYGLITHLSGIGKMKSYIIHEDTYGFFHYDDYNSKAEAETHWARIEADYEEFNKEEG